MDLAIIKHIKVDFHDSRYISVNAKQFDEGSRYILVSCYNQGKFHRLDQMYNMAFIRYRKPDLKNVFNMCQINENGEILVELTMQMLSEPGGCYADLVIVRNEPISPSSITFNSGELLSNENTQILSTMLICVNCIQNAVDNSEIESSDEYNALNELLIKATTDYSYVMTACKISAENALASEDAAALSENKAAISEQNAYDSEVKAKESEMNADTSETNALTYSNNAKISEEHALASETHAAEFQEAAETSAKEADNSASISIENAKIATDKALESNDNALMAKSYAVGNAGIRVDEDNDNARYYFHQAKAIKEGLDGAFLAMGTIEFSQLDSVTCETGYVYHIVDAFVTDERFKQGAGLSFGGGTNVYYTADGYWDCFVGESTVVVDDGIGLIVTDDGEGNVTITGYSDYLSSSRIIEELKARIETLENQLASDASN